MLIELTPSKHTRTCFETNNYDFCFSLVKQSSVNVHKIWKETFLFCFVFVKSPSSFFFLNLLTFFSCLDAFIFLGDDYCSGLKMSNKFLKNPKDPQKLFYDRKRGKKNQANWKDKFFGQINSFLKQGGN